MRVSGKILPFVLILSGLSGPRCGATVYYSNGSAANVQALLNAARDGDTITLPTGTFSWTSVLTVTKGITLQGATAITGPAGSPSLTDATIILDNTPRSGSGAGVIFATVSPSQSFRLTGITFRHGTSTTYGNGGAVEITSTGAEPNQSVRIDHCHFDHLYWGFNISIFGWIYGVSDHNLFDCNGAALSHFVAHDTWGGNASGNGSWADFPYYGTEKFWFIEDNTIRGSGTVTNSGSIDCKAGGRYVVRHNYVLNSGAGGHGTESGAERGCREREVYDNTFNWTIGWGGQLHRSGGAIWHDNTFTGRESNDQTHTHFQLFRMINGVGDDLSLWGEANGHNLWDLNATEPDGTHIDGHPPYLFESGTASVTLGGGIIQDSSKNWSTNQWAGYQVTNTNPASPAYNHASYIIWNTSNTISYYYSPSETRGPLLVFNAGDTFEIYRVITALDQHGRGKGDLTTATNPPAWPNEALEPCMSWNNVHSPTGHAYGFGSQLPTVILNRDYYNLGGGFPGDTTPSTVSSTYTAALNGVDYVGPFVYPHPLVTGVPRAIVNDFNGDGSPDLVLERAVTQETAIWYLNNNVLTGGDFGPTLPPGWRLAASADFNRDGHADYAIFHDTGYTAIWYMSGPTPVSGAWGPTLPNGWELVGAADINRDGHPDYVLYNASAHQTAIWYLFNQVLIGGDFGPALPIGWRLVGVADFDRDGHPDYLLFYPSTGDTAIWYLSGPTLIGGEFGPTIPSGWILVATADFDGDGYPDYLLYKPGTHETQIWYLNNNVFVNSASGPSLPDAWSWVEP